MEADSLVTLKNKLKWMARSQIGGMKLLTSKKYRSEKIHNIPVASRLIKQFRMD